MRPRLFAAHHLDGAAGMSHRPAGVASFLRSGAACIAVLAAQIPLDTDGRILADIALGIVVEILDPCLVPPAVVGELQAASCLPDDTVFLRRAAVL